MDINPLSFVCKFDLLLSTFSQDILNGATAVKPRFLEKKLTIEALPHLCFLLFPCYLDTTELDDKLIT